PMISTLDYPQAEIRMAATSEIEKQKRLTACKKEPETVEFIEDIPVGSVFFDIGCNTGAYSFVAAANGLKVYAFEPPGPTYERLEQNINLNSDLQVFPYDVLLGDNNVKVSFLRSSQEPGAALHQIVGGEGDGELLWQRRLDSYAFSHNLPFPEYIKLDVDGYEYKVLAGATEVLKALQGILIEVDNNLTESDLAVQFLTNHGFEIASVHPH